MYLEDYVNLTSGSWTNQLNGLHCTWWQFQDSGFYTKTTKQLYHVAESCESSLSSNFHGLWQGYVKP